MASAQFVIPLVGRDTASKRILVPLQRVDGNRPVDLALSHRGQALNGCRLCQFVEQCVAFDQVGRVEAFGELLVDRREEGLNPYGEPVTGVYVEHRADSGKGKRRGNRVGPKARAAYEMLWAMIKEGSRSFPLGGGPLRCVLMTDWRDACCQPDVLGRIKDPANRRKKFYAAREELLDKGMITVDCQSQDGADYNARVYPSRESE